MLPLFFLSTCSCYNEGKEEVMCTMFAQDIPQTIKRAFQDIREGNDPWIALGDFSHDWHGNYPAPDQRAALVAEPIELPEEAMLEQRQWAAFCAASVEYLCERAAIPTPA